MALAGAGFDPYLGFYHRPRHGRPALALDLMEPDRPIVADSTVVNAINNGEVQAADFVYSGPACALTPSGRKAFIAAYERRLDQETTHPLFGYRVTMRRLIAVQARLLARHLLGEIESIQRAAFKAVKAGATGRDIYAAAEPLVARSKHHNHLDFLAHGMGLVSHEAPRLTERGVAVPYVPEHKDKPLEESMVVSVETTLLHPTRGFIKLEDTVVTTPAGHEVYAEGGRGWNRGGPAVRRWLSCRGKRASSKGNACSITVK